MTLTQLKLAEVVLPCDKIQKQQYEKSGIFKGQIFVVPFVICW